MIRPALVFLLVAFGLSSCGLENQLNGNLSIPSIEADMPGVTFEATPDAPAGSWCTPTSEGNPPCLANSFSYDFSQQIPLLTNQQSTIDLEMSSLTITLDPNQPYGVTDLSAVQSASVMLLDPAYSTDTLPVQLEHAITIASYVKTDPNPTTITVNTDLGTNLAPYLSSGQLTLACELTYGTGENEFVADVSGFFSLDLTYDYGSEL